MSKSKEKVIEIDDDELDFLLGLLAEPAFDPRIPLEPVAPSSVRSSARRMSPEKTINGHPSEESGEASSPELARPEKKRKLSGITLAEHYPVDLMTYLTTVDDLEELQIIYKISGGIELRIPGKKDTPSRPPKGKPITDLPTGGGGNWKRKFFFTGGPWGQVAYTDGGNVYIPSRFIVPCSWGVHHGLKPKLRKRVKTALVNSYSCRDMLSTCSLVESCLVSDAYAMEDVVIGALSKKCSRPNVPKGGGSKEVPLENGSILQSELPLSRNCHLLLQRLAKAITLEEELSKDKEDLEAQRVSYETLLESLHASHQTQIENLEKEVDNQYDEGLRYSYQCIMAVLRKQHPGLKMDERCWHN
ncbi:uncharacterized protein LOC112099700 [Citrus clementina]|uniref:uncharacterized protein LOC112099700 n=1 Tax=Citrus clementina TaxID=85681 RepID=UPI000CED1CC0|nr:uncharacterized protein LOC112099700 [Citrus x clementina]